MILKHLSIALAQLRVNLFDKATNLTRVFTTMEHARSLEANYVLFPELFLSGYFIGGQIKKLAEPLNGQTVRLIQEHARKKRIGVIIGFPEVDQGCYYNSSLFIEKTGEIIGVYRKVHLYDQEKKIFQHGEDCPVFDTPFGKIGMMITYDMEFPEMARILSLKGAKAIFILSSNMVPYQHYQDIYLKARALENHVYIVNANKVGLEADTIFFGESAVISPDGSTLYKGGNNEEIKKITINLSNPSPPAEQLLLNYMENRRAKTYKAHGLV